jgi:hypothetical protein
MATNVQIDFGFVISAFVPLVFLYILGEGNLNGVWRGSLGLGVLFPILVLRKSRNRPLYSIINGHVAFTNPPPSLRL